MDYDLIQCSKQRAALGKLEKLCTGGAGATEPAGQPSRQEALSLMPTPPTTCTTGGWLGEPRCTVVNTGRDFGPKSHHHLLSMSNPCSGGLCISPHRCTSWLCR